MNANQRNRAESHVSAVIGKAAPTTEATEGRRRAPVLPSDSLAVLAQQVLLQQVSSAGWRSADKSVCATRVIASRLVTIRCFQHSGWEWMCYSFRQNYLLTGACLPEAEASDSAFISSRTWRTAAALGSLGASFRNLRR